MDKCELYMLTVRGLAALLREMASKLDAWASELQEKGKEVLR